MLTNEKVQITQIFPTQVNQNGKSTHYRQFTVRKSNDFTNEQGELIKKQPLDLFCTTWDQIQINALNNYKEGDTIVIDGYIEPIWRGFIADNTTEGDRFIIPDTGRQPITTKTGIVIQPDAEPFRMDKQVPNFYVFSNVSINVTNIRTATDMAQISQQGEAQQVSAQQIANLQAGNTQTPQNQPNQQSQPNPPNNNPPTMANADTIPG